MCYNRCEVNRKCHTDEHGQTHRLWYSQQNWLKLKEKREHNLPSLMYRTLKDRSPEYLYDKYSFMSKCTYAVY